MEMTPGNGQTLYYQRLYGLTRGSTPLQQLHISFRAKLLISSVVF